MQTPLARSNLKKFTTEKHPDYADVYLYMSVLDSGSHVGGLAAGIGTVCAFIKGYRTAIVEYYQNDLFTANVRTDLFYHKGVGG